MYHACAPGVPCSKLINLAQDETIDERALNYPPEGKKLNPWEMTENQNIVINSARSIGCQVVNIHASDLVRAAEEHKEHLVLGLIWQIVKIQLLSQISIKEVPELVRLRIRTTRIEAHVRAHTRLHACGVCLSPVQFRLLKEGEELADMLKLPPEEVLLRWVQYHMDKDGGGKKVTNLHSDLKDGEVYLRVLHSLSPEQCPIEALSNPDPATRARTVIDNATALGVPIFIQPEDIVSGNRRLNLAFVAQIFNTSHGLDVNEAEKKKIEEAFEAAGLTDEAEDDAREERVFRMWMNSLNLGDQQIARLFDDLNGTCCIVAGDDVCLPCLLHVPAPLSPLVQMASFCWMHSTRCPRVLWMRRR